MRMKKAEAMKSKIADAEAKDAKVGFIIILGNKSSGDLCTYISP